MRFHAVPSILEHRRGFRALLLRKMPHLWQELPKTADLAIPRHRTPAVNAPDMFFLVQSHSALLGTFDVHVLGTRYRTNKNPDPETDPQGSPLPGALVSTDSKTAKRLSSYSQLYGLLYPPPNEVAVDQIPRYSELRSYQKMGVEFLVKSEHALLADDMGMGKTAQCSIAIAVLRRSERIGRTLIICPRALIHQWEEEAKQWAGIHITTVDGPPAIRKHVWESSPGVLMATPNIILNDIEVLRSCRFDLVVCDDVSLLKNDGKITQAIRRIPRVRSWCLTGTPLENNPEDIINVMEFVFPGLFKLPDRKHAPSRAVIQKKLKPHFLRRRKVDHLTELPAKQSIGPLALEMTGKQREAYCLAERKQWEALQAIGIKIEKFHIFSLINALLQLCNVYEPARQSAKAEAIKGQLADIMDPTQPEVKAIVFSRWVKTLQFLEHEFREFKPQLYHGGLSDNARKNVLAKFRNEGRLLLMSTKAGSRGLNLQEASYVFHFDRGWNPMDEMQAEDRCWRFGQKQTVSVYRYIQIGTIEERINQVLLRKRGQFDQYIDSMAEDTDSLAENQWSLTELIDLVRPTEK